ncbi:YbbR-like domain-containing protein [Virgibacillus xinjiangensis]|uniref:YbbR-like domain-containing protein n=1 Tax=Virgibacillus xinjiangensis TaxID=393090 RepID=A0ABV7CZ98_9BACI
MDNWFKSKWFIRVLALAFAVLLYVFVNVEVNTSTSESAIPGRATEVKTIEEVPVEIRIDQEQFVVSGVPEYVTVSLEGTPALLAPTVLQESFDVFVDLQGLEEGEHTVEIQHEDLSNQLTAYIEPKTVEVTIEERATEEFEVGAEFLNEDELPTGFELGDYNIEPQTVTITSSQSVIDEIGVVNVYVNLSGVEESINNRELPVNVYDTQGNELNVRVEPENVQFSAELENPSKKVPVNVATSGEAPEGYEITSISASVEEVEVYATSDTLEGIEEISTEEIDLTERTESETIEAELDLPDGAVVPEPETVEVEIEVDQTETIEDVSLQTEGLEEGHDLQFIDPGSGQMDLLISGSQPEISQLDITDFLLTIDLSGMSVGEHLVPVVIEGPDSDGYDVTGEYEEVTVAIN